MSSKSSWVAEWNPASKQKSQMSYCFIQLIYKIESFFLKKKWNSLMQGDLNNSIANIFRKLGHVKIWTYIWVIRVCLYRILLMESSEHIVIENADVLCVLKVFYKTQAFLTSFMATVITGVYLKKKLTYFLSFDGFIQTCVRFSSFSLLITLFHSPTLYPWNLYSSEKSPLLLPSRV